MLPITHTVMRRQKSPQSQPLLRTRCQRKGWPWGPVLMEQRRKDQSEERARTEPGGCWLAAGRWLGESLGQDDRRITLPDKAGMDVVQPNASRTSQEGRRGSIWGEARVEVGFEGP